MKLANLALAAFFALVLFALALVEERTIARKRRRSYFDRFRTRPP